MAQIFYGKAGVSGTELWLTSGVNAGQPVQSIDAATTGLVGLKAVGNAVYFDAGGAPWVSRGTVASTLQLKVHSPAPACRCSPVSTAR